MYTCVILLCMTCVICTLMLYVHLRRRLVYVHLCYDVHGYVITHTYRLVIMYTRRLVIMYTYVICTLMLYVHLCRLVITHTCVGDVHLCYMYTYVGDHTHLCW